MIHLDLLTLPAMCGCSCGFGMWLHIGDDWEHWTPDCTSKGFWFLADGQGDDCRMSDNPTPVTGNAITKCRDCADGWRIRFAGRGTAQHARLIDGVFIKDDGGDCLPF